MVNKLINEPESLQLEIDNYLLEFKKEFKETEIHNLWQQYDFYDLN